MSLTWQQKYDGMEEYDCPGCEAEDSIVFDCMDHYDAAKPCRECGRKYRRETDGDCVGDPPRIVTHTELKETPCSPPRGTETDR